jgi:predicted DNA binding protein
MRQATLLLKIPGNWIGALSTACDLSIRVMKCVPRSGNGGQSFLQIDGPSTMTQEALVERIRSVEPRCNVQLSDAGPGRHVGTVEIAACAACKLVAESRCFLDSAISRENGSIQWNILAPNASDLRELVEKIKTLGGEVKVEKVSVLRTASELTVAQERVLQLAFELGYYDIPKRTNLDRLAKRLEISKATLDVMLRRAQRKLVASHVGGIA